MTKDILIVDDAENIVISLEFLMKKEGFNVRVASDGDAALQAMRDHVPDLVLLDVMMPKRDGYEVCQTIKASAEWQKTRIIMLTAKSRDVEREKGLAMGADDYITKPFATRELVAKVRKILKIDKG
ncbi:MAG: response regulator [Magnetococcales bacterium]|nr:response regulator [Magnetococcales bacterium]